MPNDLPFVALHDYGGSRVKAGGFRAEASFNSVPSVAGDVRQTGRHSCLLTMGMSCGFVPSENLSRDIYGNLALRCITTHVAAHNP